MLDPDGAPLPADLDVVPGLDRGLKNVEERRHGAGALVDARVLRADLPHPDLAVLVAGEDLVVGDDDRLNEAAVGLEGGEVLHPFPNPNVLAVGAGVEDVVLRREGVDVAFLAD